MSWITECITPYKIFAEYKIHPLFISNQIGRDYNAIRDYHFTEQYHAWSRYQKQWCYHSLWWCYALAHINNISDIIKLSLL